MDRLDKDRVFMQEAIKEALKALRREEVPVGAVIVCDNKIIARAYNQREGSFNPVFHAEIIAITKASKKLKRWRLNDCTMYVTLEPCVMCAGAIVNARINRLVYGCKDPKAGAVDSLYNILKDDRLNHCVGEVLSGVMAQECSSLLSEFFSSLRHKKKEYPKSFSPACYKNLLGIPSASK